MRHRLRRLADLAPVEWFLLPLLVACAFVVAIGLRVMPLPALLAGIDRVAIPSPLWARLLGSSPEYACRRLWLADLSARCVAGEGRCLVRSLLIYGVLRATGQGPSLRIGVHPEHRPLRAHAWVEAHGQVVWDTSAHIAGFATLPRF